MWQRTVTGLMSIAESLLNVLDSCSLSEATKKNKTQKKTMHDSFPVLVVESIPFLNFKDEWLWVWVVALGMSSALSMCLVVNVRLILGLSVHCAIQTWTRDSLVILKRGKTAYASPFQQAAARLFQRSVFEFELGEVQLFLAQFCWDFVRCKDGASKSTHNNSGLRGKRYRWQPCKIV